MCAMESEGIQSNFTPLGNTAINAPDVRFKGPVSPEMTVSSSEVPEAPPEASQGALSRYPALPYHTPVQFPGRKSTPEEAVQATGKLEDINIFQAAFRGNVLPTMYRSMQREFEFDPDPSFDNKSWFSQNAGRVPASMWPGLMEAESAEEGEAIINQMTSDSQDRQALHNAGLRGVAAELVMGLFDIDSLVIMAPSITKMGKALTIAGRGGAAASAEAALALRQPATLLSQTVESGATGAAVGASFGAGQYVFDPNAEPSAIAGGMLFGLGLGAGLGAAVATPGTLALRARANRIASEMPADFMHSFSDSRYGIDRNAWNTDPPHSLTPGGHEGSVFSWSKSSDMIQAASEAAKNIPNKIKDSPIARNFQKLIDKSFLESDAARLFNSGSDVLKVLAYETLEHPSGVFRNNRSSAMLKRVYEENILSPFMESYENLYSSWTKSRGIGLWDSYSGANRDLFHKELILEQHHKAVNDGVSAPNSSQQVKDAGALIDKGSAAADTAMKGRAGEVPMEGSLGFESYPGYFPLVHSGLKTIQAIDKFGEKRVLDLVKKAYTSMLPNADGRTVHAISKALISRNKAKGKDMDVSSFHYNHADPRARMKQIMDDLGIPENTQTDLLARMVPEVEERGRAGFTKRRTPIDLTASDGELSMMDLIDTNVPMIWSRYGRSSSGRAALARKGITSKAKLDEIISTGLEEAQAKGSNLTSDYVQGIFEEFSGGPTHGGLSPAMRRIRQGTNLSLLSQLGIPQLAEYGVIVSAIGVDRFLHYSPIAARLVKEGKAGKLDLAEQLQFFAGTSANDHRLYRADLALDYARSTAQENNKLLRGLDKVLARGQRIQGYLSGYYAVRPLQMKTAILGVSDKFFNHLRAGNWKELSRWEDLGFTKKIMQEFKDKYVDSGIVKWGENGKYVDDLGLDSWSARDIEDYRLALHRFTSQVIQRAEIGETSGWFHKDAWAFLTHLNQFPLLALQKQLTRNLRISDPASMTTFLYGMTSASMAYAIKQIVNGKFDRLEPEQIARGGLALSNMTGFLPMMFDPLMYAMGADNYMLSPYGGTGGRAATLPAMQVTSDLMKLPRPLFNKQFKPADAKAFHSIPLIGRMYGVSALIDAIASDDATKKPVGW